MCLRNKSHHFDLFGHLFDVWRFIACNRLNALKDFASNACSSPEGNSEGQSERMMYVFYQWDVSRYGFLNDGVRLPAVSG